jgi:transposase
MPPALAAELAPLRALWAPVNTQIAAADARLAHVAASDPVVAQLMTTPGIGPVTAVAFVATLDVVTRFASAHQVEAYLGLTPREYSSGEQQRRGRISKTGNARMRYLLVEAAWRVLRSKDPAAAPLRTWADGIAQRRGRSIAAVALARRLAGILYAMWRDGKDYRAPQEAAVA